MQVMDLSLTDLLSDFGFRFELYILIAVFLAFGIPEIKKIWKDTKRSQEIRKDKHKVAQEMADLYQASLRLLNIAQELVATDANGNKRLKLVDAERVGLSIFYYGATEGILLDMGGKLISIEKPEILSNGQIVFGKTNELSFEPLNATFALDFVNAVAFYQKKYNPAQ